MPELSRALRAGRLRTPCAGGAGPCQRIRPALSLLRLAAYGIAGVVKCYPLIRLTSEAGCPSISLNSFVICRPEGNH